MPAIILRITFTKLLGKKLGDDEVMTFLSRKFTRIDESEFTQKLANIWVWEENPNQKLLAVKGRILGSFALGETAETKLGIINSTYPDSIEFWICSSKVSECIKERKCVIKHIPNFKNRVLKRIESDFLLLEGGTEIDREKTISRYVLKSSLNAGLGVNFVIAALNSVYRYFVFQEIGYQLPLMIFAVWFIALFVALTYYRGKGIYVVNEKGN